MGLMLSRRDEVVLASVRDGAHTVADVLEATEGVDDAPLTPKGAKESLQRLTSAGHIELAGVVKTAWVMAGPVGSVELEVKRLRAGCAYGPYGSASYYEDGRPDVGTQVSPEVILGRPLADGARVQVTVEVIEEAAWPPKISPWQPGMSSSDRYLQMTDEQRADAWREHEGVS